MKLATVNTWNDTAGSVSATILGGPSITAWPVGWWPAPNDICWVEEAGDGTWICNGIRGATGHSNTYTPIMGATGGAPLLGASSLVGYYTRIGKWVDLQIVLTVGSGFNGSTGSFSFTLPVVGAVREQELMSKLYCAGAATNWKGVGYIAASSTVIVPYLPNSQSDCRLSAAQNADVTAAAGTGVPAIPSVYPLTAGSNLILTGRYETS